MPFLFRPQVTSTGSTMATLHGVRLSLTYYIYSIGILTVYMSSVGGESNGWSSGIADTLDAVTDTAEQQANAGGHLAVQFERFMTDYGKSYASLADRMMRFEIFKENLNLIERLMTDAEQTAVFGIGPFADLTSDEFMRKYTGLRWRQKRLKNHVSLLHRRAPGGTDGSVSGKNPPPKLSVKNAANPSTPSPATSDGRTPLSPKPVGNLGTNSPAPALVKPSNSNNKENSGVSPGAGAKLSPKPPAKAPLNSPATNKKPGTTPGPTKPGVQTTWINSKVYPPPEDQVIGLLQGVATAV